MKRKLSSIFLSLFFIFNILLIESSAGGDDLLPDPLPDPLSDPKENLIINPGFEEGMNNWTVGKYPYDSNGTVQIESKGYWENGLEMHHGNSTWQACSQTVGTLKPGKVYLLSVMFNTSFTHYGYINLHDRNWNRPDGGNGKSYTTILQGRNGWIKLEKRVRIPFTDDSGDSTADDSWTVILYSHYPYDDNSPVLYDNITLIEQDTSKIPTIYEDIEEIPDWNIQCQKYTNGYPLVKWNTEMLDQRSSDDTFGEFALVVKGNQTIENSFSITLPVKPDTKYRFSARMMIENRTAYNYLDLDYPDWLVKTQEGVHTTVMGTRGIWCGLFSLNLKDTDGEDINFLKPDIIDHPYISHSDVDWFGKDSYIQTGNDSCEITITIKTEGFLGSLCMDDIKLEEVWSFIDERYLHIPIETDFQGMSIEHVSVDPLFVRTNSATYSFGIDHISMEKDGGEVGRLIFLDGDILQNLRIERETGLVILENKNIVMSIGADSSAIFKLKRDINIIIKGPKPEYHSFEAGIIFSTDYSKGVLFSPIYPTSVLKGMPYKYEYTSNYVYEDGEFEEAGLKNWEIITDFSEDTWRIRYSFQRGDGFLTSIFPPKEFNQTKLYKEKVATAGIDLNQYPDADYSYYIQKFKERNNIALLWMNGYAASTNDQNPPGFYYLDHNNIPVSPDHPDARPVPFTPIDIAGPYTVEQKEALHRLVKEAHRQECKVIVYMSPRFFYTSDIEIFIRNLEYNIDEFNLDGVYYDGYYEADPLLNLELVRKTKNILGEKFYCQHNSWTDTVIRRSDHFRVPFYEAYADRLWVGESVKKVDEDTFRLNYCGMNVSNTASTLLSEFRPVNYSLLKEESLSRAIPVKEQIDRQLKYNGEFRLPAFGYQGYIHEKRFQTTEYFDAKYYWDREYTAGLEFTSGDGDVDVCEDIYTASADCAPVTGRAVLENEGNVYTCETDLSVAQWVVDNEPFYDLHFTFDDLIASDDSDHRMNPSQDIGYRKDQDPPQQKQMDGRKVFEFRDGRKLYSTCDSSLDYTDRSFSSFAVIKRNDSSASKQVVFSLNDNENFYFGIEDSRFNVYPRDGDLVYGTEEIVINGYEGNGLRMYHNDASWQATYQRIGRLVPGGSYDLSVMFKTTSSHQAYVNLYTPEWKNGEGEAVGKSFIPTLMNGIDGWTDLSMNVTIPLTMDNGEPSSECQWSVILYGHAPLEDNNPIFYDNITLRDGSSNLVKNGDFESGFDFWVHYSYIPEERISANTEIEMDQWYTVGIVYDSSVLSLYVNGIKETERIINITGFLKYGNYTIGAYDKLDRTRTFNGYIDDLFLSSRVLTEDQIMQYHETTFKVLTIDYEDVRCIVTDDGKFYTANRFPKIDSIDEIFIYEDEPFEFNLTAVDQNDDSLSWKIDTDANWMEIDGSGPSLKGTPENKDVGSWLVNITVTDTHGGFDQFDLMIHVLNTNDPPKIDPIEIEEAYEDEHFEAFFSATDIDPTDDELFWMVHTECVFLHIDRTSGLLSGTPGSEDIGTHRVNVTVFDGNGGCDSINFTLIVKGTNDPPVLDSPPIEITIDEDNIYSDIDLLDWFYDPDGDELDFIIGPSTNLELTIINGSNVVIRPALDWSGTEAIRFTANDTVFSVSHILSVVVLPVNDPPEGASILFENRSYFENGDQPAIGLAFDPDLEYGDILTYRWYSNISGELDCGREIDLSLLSGFHNITLEVVDLEGLRTSTWAQIEVLDDPNGKPGDYDNGNEDEGDDENPGSLENGLSTIVLLIILSILLVVVFVILMKTRRSDDDYKEE